MAKSKTRTISAVTEELEPLEVEVKAPTVVLSVRLDEATAKRLHAIAKRRGVRVSDVLRDAATAFGETHAVGHGFAVNWYEASPKRFELGTARIATIVKSGEPSTHRDARPLQWSTALTRD